MHRSKLRHVLPQHAAQTTDLSLYRINKFVEAHSYLFTPLDSVHDSITDTNDDSDSVADVDPDTSIRIVRTELKNGKAPGIDNVYNIILKKAIGTGFYKILARAFTISLKLGFIPYVWKVATFVCSLSLTNCLHKLLAIDPLVYLVR